MREVLYTVPVIMTFESEDEREQWEDNNPGWEHLTEERRGLFHGFGLLSTIYRGDMGENIPLSNTVALIEDESTGYVHRIDVTKFRFVD